MEMKVDDQQEFVYVMAARAGAVKIGYTRDPAKRLSAIRAGWVPDSVDRDDLEVAYLIEGTRDLERELHTHFRQQRVTGEWFNLGPAAAAVMHVADVVRRYAVAKGLPEPKPLPPPQVAQAVPIEGTISTAEWNAYLDSRSDRPVQRRPEPGPDMPPGVAAVALRHREYFQAWMAAGFTEAQAIQLVAALAARDQG